METLTIKIPEEKSSVVKELLKQYGVTIIDNKSEILYLSSEQKQEIISSQEQVKDGLFVEQSALDDEIHKWLKK